MKCICLRCYQCFDTEMERAYCPECRVVIHGAPADPRLAELARLHDDIHLTLDILNTLATLAPVKVQRVTDGTVSALLGNDAVDLGKAEVVHLIEQRTRERALATELEGKKEPGNVEP